MILLLLLVLAGCASMQNTLAQDLAWERWNRCSNFRGITLKEIKTDGTIWVWIADGGERTAWSDCDSAMRVEQAKGVAASIPKSAVVASSATSDRAVLSPPEWKVGDEWAFRSEGPAGMNSVVWTVDREEAIDGIAHSVIRVGVREIFYRKHDFTFIRETADGKTVRQVTPPAWRFVVFPLEVGKSWEMRWSDERPVDRTTEQVHRKCAVEAFENVSVPAGTFGAYRVSCHSAPTSEWVMTIWYSADVRQWIREEAKVTGGRRVRELIAFKLR